MSIRRRAALVTIGLLVAAASILYVIRPGALRSAPAATPVANRAFPSASDPSAPATVWAVGDGAAATTGARALAARLVKAHPARMLYLGDVYEDGRPGEFERHFRRLYGPLLHRIAPTPGNHEWSRHRSGYDPFWRAITGAPTPPWYGFRLGGWQVLSLNSETAGDHRQLRWLRRRLTGARGTCTLAFWHRPRFSAGPHGDQKDTAPLWNALRGHAALVLNGHDHDMQRLRPIDGITEVVAGAGGRSHYAVDRGDRRLAFADDRHYGALRLRLSRGRAGLAFVTAGGAVLDRSSVTCAPSG